MTAHKDDNPKVVKMRQKKAAPTTSWQEHLIQGDKGSPKACVANAIAALRYAPEWDGVLWHDEFAIRTVIRRPTPWTLNTLDFEDTEWTDCDDIRLAEWLQHKGISVTPAVAGQAVEVASRIHTYHPVRQYLQSLKWDRKRRLSFWLRDYLGVADSDYSQAIAARWMISAVARIFQPGCKADPAIILEGPQGLKKSTALSILGGPWFTDQLADMGNKDSCVDVQGAWIIELSELDSMRRGDISTIKAFMSRPTDRFRMPYGKRTAKFPRQCIFAGTINPEGDGYLKDPTGGRRFWPVRCTKIDADALRENVDQLWAEAVAMYDQGYTWWLDTQELEELAAEEQSERYQGDAWDGLILRYLTHYKVPVTDSYGSVVNHKWVERDKPLIDISIAEVMTDILEIPVERWNKKEQMRIGGILTALKFERYRVSVNGTRGYRYAKPCPTSPEKPQGRAAGRAAKNASEIMELDASCPTCPTCPTFSENLLHGSEKDMPCDKEYGKVGQVGQVGQNLSKPLNDKEDSLPYLSAQGRAADKVGQAHSENDCEYEPEEWGL